MFPFLSNRLIICLILLVSFGLSGLPNGSAAQTGTSLPVLTSTLATQYPSALVSVSGNGFTSGGLVFVALYDQWGEALQENRWTIATTPFYGPNGSMDPAQGYRPGGTISEVFELLKETTYGPNGSQDPALGYSPGIDALNIADAVYGPNGSQDPAQGYVAASCDAQFMVRAFDNQTQAWSNTMDVHFGC